jgi:hypothetical protein
LRGQHSEGRRSDGAMSGSAVPPTSTTTASSPHPEDKETPIPKEAPLTRQTSVAATISSFFGGSGDTDHSPRPPIESRKADNMDDAYRSRAEAFAKRQADNDAEKKR